MKVKKILKNKELITGIVLFIFVLAVYIFYLSPSIHSRDNADTVTAAATLGIAHSPGYPLYTILGHLFTKIPIGTIPYRVNLMSAIFSALSILMIYLIIFKLSKNIWAAAIASTILAFSYFYFLQSLYADFLSLNNLLVGIEILFLINWYQNKEIKYLYIAAFLAGLAFSHHQISFVIFPAIIYLVIVTDKKVLQTKKILTLVGLFLVGLLPYIYLPIRTAFHPSYYWGQSDTVSGFFTMISRKEYTANAFSQILNSPYRIWDWFRQSIWNEFVIIGFLLGIGGLWALRKKDKKLFVFLLIMLIFTGPIFALFSNTAKEWIELIGMERFFIFFYMIFTIPIGLGIAWILQQYRQLKFLLLVFPVALLFYNAHKVDLRNYYFAYDLGQNIFKSLPQNTVLFAGSDVPLFELWYLQKVEHVREDVHVIAGADPKFVGLPDSRTAQILKDFPDYKLPIEELVKKYPVYTTNNIDIFWGPETKNFVPEGIVYRYDPDPNWRQNFDGQKSLQDFSSYQMRGQYSIAKQPDRFTHEILYYYVNGWTNLGIALQSNKKPSEAAAAYIQALKIDPGFVIAFNNYAGTLLDRGQYQEAIDRYKAILKRYPNLTSAQNGLLNAQKKLYEEQQKK